MTYNEELQSNNAELEEVLQTVNELPDAGSGTSVQADWNQTDETAADFIKNKPFYENSTYTEILPETTVIGEATDTAGVYAVQLDYSLFASGLPNAVKVIFDGVEYFCVADEAMLNQGGGVYGNYSLQDPTTINTGEPFMIFAIPAFEMAMLFLSDGEAHTICVQSCEREIKKLNADLVDAKWMATAVDAYTNIAPRTTVNIEASDYAEITGSYDTENMVSTYEKYRVVWNGQIYHCYATVTQVGSENVTLLCFGLNPFNSELTGEYPFGIAIRPDKVVVYAENAGEATFSIDGIDELPNKLPEAFLPDTVTKNGDTELILTSSTDGSTKQFKITVDDSGILTVTEVAT